MAADLVGDNGQVDPAEEAFASEAESFLGANAELRQRGRASFGHGSDELFVIPERSALEQERAVADAKQWARVAFDAGFGWITGPGRYGGRDLPMRFQRIYDSIEARYETPSQAPRGIGIGMVAPTILAHGTDAVKERYLRAIHRGDIIACQLFSEPSAGSDLASLTTRAERDGDEWVISGQKVWTSGAQYADVGEILCRTDPALEKHRGITAFVLDMHAAGVEVRPLRQMTGGSSFNEVFLSDVRVPADHLLGELNGGWTVALTTLSNERAAIGGGGASVPVDEALDRLIELSRQLGSASSPLIRQELAEVFTSVRVARFTNERALARIRSGQAPGPELSIAKLALTRNLSRIAEVASHVLGARLAADSGEWGTYAWARFLLGVPGIRVAGGTDEIMRNIIGERVLGLPKEPRIEP
jgi:alkylation response protein AidB-like acyl-CoA dehydrogenase